jgi:hypothetical protein
MAKKISKTKGLVCVSLVFVLSRRNEKAVRDFSEVFCFLFFYFLWWRRLRHGFYDGRGRRVKLMKNLWWIWIGCEFEFHSDLGFWHLCSLCHRNLLSKNFDLLDLFCQFWDFFLPRACHYSLMHVRFNLYFSTLFVHPRAFHYSLMHVRFNFYFSTLFVHGGFFRIILKGN